jgi:integrase
MGDRDGRNTHLAHLKTEGRTERYRRNLRTYLAQWAESLAGRDLRTVTLQELKRELAKRPAARKHRIIALKRKKGYTMQEVEAFYRAISGWESPKLGGLKTDVQTVRDIVLHAKTGMHRSEIERVARGDCELKPVEHSEIRGVVRFTHKSGRIHTQSLDAQSFMAAQRLQARGGAPADSWVRKVLRHTAKLLEREPIKLGQMRHSFVSWALTHGVEARPAEGGVPLATVASIVGHTSANTTSRFYDVTEMKPMIRLPLRLEHPEDPVPLPLPNRQLRNHGG